MWYIVKRNVRVEHISSKTAYPIGILLADGFKYYVHGPVCWMLEV